MRSHVVLMALVLMAGCATIESGQEISTAHVASLTPGVTTYVDARQMFGRPNSEVFLAGDRKLVSWTWIKSKGTMFGAEAESRTISLIFDSKNVLEKVAGEGASSTRAD